MAVSETNTKVDVLADKKEILRKRGVPEKFVAGVAAVDSLDNSQNRAMGMAMVAVIGPLVVLVITGLSLHKHVVNWLFAAQIKHSDMFAGGIGLGALWVWLLFSLCSVVPIAFALMARRETFRYGVRGELQPVRPMAFWLCDRRGQRLDDIAADPRLATLGELKTAKAFLEDVGAHMTADQLGAQDRAVHRERLTGLAILVGWGLATWGMSALALDNYTRIDDNAITYASPWTHLSVPLAQVTAVNAYCYYGGKHNDLPRLAYHVSYGGRDINLFNTDDLGDEADTVNRLARIDARLQADGVTMHKSKPFDQLTSRQQHCLDRYGLGAGSDDPKKHQLLFGPDAESRS